MRKSHVANVVILDVRVDKIGIITGRLEVRPDGDPVLVVVHHLDTVGIDDLLLLEVPPGVLGDLLVLLEHVAGPQLECIPQSLIATV